MTDPIRRISIGINPKEQFHYTIGTEFNVVVNSMPQKRTLNQIEETETHYILYTKKENEVQKWKKIPKNNHTTEEYEID